MPLFSRRFAAIAATTLLSAGLTAGLTTTTAHAVVGGAFVAPPPWLASVGTPAFLVRPTGQFCGGALIGPDRVATAAHCVDFLSAVPTLLSVTFGRADLSKKDGETIQVKKVWVDPGFRETAFKGETVEHHDVAVLTLARPVLDRIALPPIGRGGVLPPTGTAQVYGWGTMSERDLFNARLRGANVPLVPDARCASAYGGSFDKKDMVCAGSTTADTCQFDSGGPLVVQGRLAGITSWAYGCARPGYPGVYSRLSAVTLPL